MTARRTEEKPMTTETTYYSDGTLQITDESVTFEARDHYLVEDIAGVSAVFTRVYALVTIGFVDGTERSFAPPDQVTAIDIINALTRALGGIGCPPWHRWSSTRLKSGNPP